MGYMHIENLYKSQAILMFKECFAMEKVHGTSAHITWKDGQLIYFAGGSKHETFVSLFDDAALRVAFTELGHPEITVFGEAYGGKINGQSWRYGKAIRFVAFEVQIGESWLPVVNAEAVAQKLGFTFVHYRREERETKTPRKVVEGMDGFAVLEGAEKIATEWVTTTRLEHVLDKLGGSPGMERTSDVIAAMTEDVLREGAGEIVDTKEARKAIGRAAVELFKRHIKARLYSEAEGATTP